MAKSKATPATGIRRCIGSERFGIEAHDAPAGDFPAQPSQKDGLGRMCKTHWRQYTAALSKAARERKAAAGEAAPEAEPAPVAEPAPEATEADDAEPKVAKAKPTKPASAKSRATPATDAPTPGDGLGAWRAEHGTEE